VKFTPPPRDHMLFIRTDFSDDGAWRTIVDAATQKSRMGYQAALHLVDDRAYERATVDDVVSSNLFGKSMACFVADERTMADPDHAILCINLMRSMEPFRVVPEWVSDVEANLSIANVDFEDYAEQCGADGVYRGYEPNPRTEFFIQMMKKTFNLPD